MSAFREIEFLTKGDPAGWNQIFNTKELPYYEMESYPFQNSSPIMKEEAEKMC